MIKLWNYPEIAFLLLLPLVSAGQFSRSQAIQLVLEQVLVNDLEHIDVYASYDAITGPGYLPHIKIKPLLVNISLTIYSPK